MNELSSAILPSARPSRIVLAEDDEALRELLATVLEGEGHEVLQAASGNELIDRIKSYVSKGEAIDLIISDVRMPKMSGLLVLKLLRDAELVMPVILMTGFSDSGTRREACEQGAVLLDKPVQLRTLRSEVARALQPPGGDELDHR